MSILVAIEGADGAGKATAAANVRNMLEEIGHSACVISFPRYRETAGGFALGHFLAGDMPVSVTPKAAAVLYALDRLESSDVIQTARAAYDVIVFDRYIASNIVYQASKVRETEASLMADWILELETMTFGITPPDLSVYLDTPLNHAHKFMLLKHRRSYTDRQFDEHEADLTLQQKVRVNYAALASKKALSPWHVVETVKEGEMRSPLDIAQEIVDRILRDFGNQLIRGNLSNIASSA